MANITIKNSTPQAKAMSELLKTFKFVTFNKYSRFTIYENCKEATAIIIMLESFKFVTFNNFKDQIPYEKYVTLPTTPKANNLEPEEKKYMSKRVQKLYTDVLRKNGVPDN